MMQLSEHHSALTLSCEPNYRSQIINIWWQGENKYFHPKISHKCIKIESALTIFQTISVNKAIHFTNRNQDRASKEQTASSAYHIVSNETLAEEHAAPVHHEQAS